MTKRRIKNESRIVDRSGDEMVHRVWVIRATFCRTGDVSGVIADFLTFSFWHLTRFLRSFSVLEFFARVLRSRGKCMIEQVILIWA